VEGLWKEYRPRRPISLISELGQNTTLSLSAVEEILNITPFYAIENDRQFVAWLNSESLEFGGRFVETTMSPRYGFLSSKMGLTARSLMHDSVRMYESAVWWGTVVFEQPIISMKTFIDAENKPRSQQELRPEVFFYDDNW
jgi:hypothetical protein